MKRPWQIWFLFLLCLALVLPAMVWLTMKTLELDRARTLARRQAEEARSRAELQELISSALWQMDWMLTPIVAQEAARPYYVYDSFLTDVSASAKVQPVASPLLLQPSQYVLLHFQLTPDGTWTSPQRPTGFSCEVAIQQGTPEANIIASGRRLALLKPKIQYESLLAKLPDELLPAIQLSRPDFNNLSFNYDDSGLDATSPWNTQDFGLPQLAVPPAAEKTPPQSQAAEPGAPPQAQDPQAASPSAGRQALAASGPPAERQQLMRQNEWYTRNRAYEAYAKSQVLQQRAGVVQEQPVPRTVSEGVSRPLWVGSELLLARRVLRNEVPIIQGCWLNWPRIKDMLLQQITDTLPNADLLAVAAEADVQPSRMLATLPVRLVAAGPPPPPKIAGPLTPMQWSLVIAWSCLLLATAAVAILLRGVVALSERRAAFVSAVTHELRTPLTTFRMYAEMLAEGMVTDASRRKTYIETLRIEADRLAHLVENVLSYARLERGRKGRQRVLLDVPKFIEQIQPRLRDRAAQADMQLVVESEVSGERRLLTDPSAVEQVLFNLVDNACKYAVTATDRRIHLSAKESQGVMSFVLRDHGPGLARRRGRFRPFSKSVQQAANSVHGVGLGLALCHRLARWLGGTLSLQEPAGGGAQLVLALPLTPTRDTEQ